MKIDKIKLPFKIKSPVLALGSQTKNRVSFAEGDSAYLSPVHADLNNPQDYSSFEQSAGYFLKKKPEIIAYDPHPEYQSTKYALGLNAKRYKLCAIQHHHAHIASCMAENGLGNKKVIGVAFDGTGLGQDNHLWGAEFLICDYGDYKREAHLKEVPLLGGERAIIEPVRILAAWLYSMGRDKFFSSWVKGIDRNKQRVLKNMYLSGFNSPLSSSMGRLFDAAGSLVAGRERVDFEAELAMELEKTAKRYTLYAKPYGFKIVKTKGAHIIDPALIFKGIISDLQKKAPAEKIAYGFHVTVAQMIRKTCLILRRERKINKVVLSGGVFQNKLLLSLALDLLYKEDFCVFTHQRVSCNDSGISLGQAVVGGS